VKNKDKREEIMRAALKLIAEHGFHGAPMAMIADKAGVSAGTIYRYFESKDELITELFRDLEKKILAVLLEGYSDDKPLRERFLHIGTGILRHFIANPIHFRFIEQYHNSPYWVSLRREMLLGKSDDNIFKGFFEQGVYKKVLKDLPLPVHFALAFGPLFSLARDHILGFVRLDDALIMKTMEACWDGIKR
jgi:TetR/AcrR family transcriptional regulator, repressor of fatR-cypB operon